MKQNRKAQDLFDRNYKSDWRYFPTCETPVKLSLNEKKLHQISNSSTMKEESNRGRPQRTSAIFRGGGGSKMQTFADLTLFLPGEGGISPLIVYHVTKSVRNRVKKEKMQHNEIDCVNFSG